MDNNLLAAEFFIIVAIITGDEVIKNGRVPLPSRYLFAGVAFVMLGLASPLISTRLVNVLGLGVLSTVLYQMLDPGAGETPGQGHNTETPAKPA